MTTLFFKMLFQWMGWGYNILIFSKKEVESFQKRVLFKSNIFSCFKIIIFKLNFTFSDSLLNAMQTFYCYFFISFYENDIIFVVAAQCATCATTGTNCFDKHDAPALRACCLSITILLLLLFKINIEKDTCLFPFP